MKKIIIAIIVIALVGAGIYYFTNSSNKIVVNNDQEIATTTDKVATTTVIENKAETVIGKSVEGNEIKAYHFGTGNNEVLFVGGIHGGYEWNTVLVANTLMDYLRTNPDTVPANVKVTVIPVLNPDGLNKVVGTTGSFTSADVSSSQSVVTAGRFNANNVDLNRNFDCDWQTTGTWQNKSVSGGNKAFSEPESVAIKNYITAQNPKAVVVWFSAAGGVYSSNCHNGILPQTTTLTNTYAKASGYSANNEFNFYETTGDITNWLAKINVPAISILLTNHTDTEWAKNLAGIKAILKLFN